MAMRRPRIKPVANILLNSKRKTKPSNDVKSDKVCGSDVNNGLEVQKPINILQKQEEQSIGSIDNAIEVIPESPVDTTANGNNLNNNNATGRENNDVHKFDNAKKDDSSRRKNENVPNVKKYLINNSKELSKNAPEEVLESLNDSEAFKCPNKVGFQRTITHTSNSGIDDVFYSDIEENALQMDSEKSPSNSCPMSPTKNLARQRIRPTPHFGQRRNSFVGSSPSPHTPGNDDTPSNSNFNNEQTTQTRRERHHSASFAGNSHSSTSVHHHHTPQKYFPAGIINSSMGRIRTESGCSVFSDTNTSSHKLRKTEDHKHNFRKDFEARFPNKVPEKNALKMCDLIYYNPVTNPMEQKPNPSAKLEQAETSPKDAKPFTEEIEKEIDGEAVPVPQLKLNAKGELILDDSSLVIETTAEQEARKVLANSSLIYLDEYTGMNGFYSRQKRTRKWESSETIKFYRCLQNVGTDFSLMVSLFPNRTRRDLKLKFKKEERKNSHLINKALIHPKQFDIESLKLQLNEEEKVLVEMAKDKKKSKKSEKRKYSNIKSKANRVLIHGDVYQNEIEQTPKRLRKTNITNEKSNDTAQNEKEITEASRSKEVKHSESVHTVKLKRRRKNIPKKFNRSPITLNNNSVDQQLRTPTTNKVLKEGIVKEEIIKIENKQESNQTSASTEYQDTKQLQTEMDELLDSDAVDIQYGNTLYETSTVDEFVDISNTEQYIEQINEAPRTVSHTTHKEDCIESDTEIDKYEHRSFVNVDDGSVSVYSNIKDDIVFITSPTTSLPSRSPSPVGSIEMENENNSLKSTIPDLDINNDTCSSVISERELSESDIQSILTELAEGSLVLVSTLDPDDPDKVLNEIYMVDKDTGDICDEPLNIPDNIVQCILTVVS